MKIKVTTVEEIEVDIQFPCYRKQGPTIYKVLDEQSVVSACGLERHMCIQNSYIECAFAKDTTESTREEFDATWRKAYDALFKLGV